jgi:hypothetical protein
MANSQILRVSIVGAMPSGEEWSVNPCWEVDGSTGALVTPADAATIATAIAALSVPATLQQTFAAATTVTGCRVEGRTLAGSLEVQAEAVRGTPVAGTGTSPHPYQTSIVISLRTPLPGARSRGRMYWPATGVVLQPSTLRLSTTLRDSILGGARSYLNAIEGAIKATQPNANLTVWSRTGSSFANVNQLQVGDVVDTQRRRRDTLIEGYGSIAFP